MPGNRSKSARVAVAAGIGVAATLALGWIGGAEAAGVALPGIDIRIDSGTSEPQEVASAIKILIGLTVLSLAPAILVVMTAFTRIIIVLSMLRHAIGMPDTPPNTVV